jgi:hypothetical protein
MPSDDDWDVKQIREKHKTPRDLKSILGTNGVLDLKNVAREIEGARAHNEG